MNSRTFWLLGIVGLAALGGVWFLGRGSAPDLLAEPTGDRSALAHPGPLSTPGRAQEGTQGEGAALERGANGPANADRATAAREPAKPAARPDAREREFIASLLAPPGPSATDDQRLAWEESPVSDLLYPPGHACAGQPLDSTSPQVLTQAAKQVLAQSINNIPDVDEPQCVYSGNWPFHPLNAACSGMRRDDPKSVAECTHFLQTSQQDPQAYPATVWLPSVNGCQPTTRREYFEGILAEQVDQLFSGPRCTAN